MGVILNDPGEMLDATPDFIPWNSGASAFQLGGQWQVFARPCCRATGVESSAGWARIAATCRGNGSDSDAELLGRALRDEPREP